MNETGYISRQIAVYKTDKKLVELTDKLNPAPLELYARIHAHGDDNGAGQMKSRSRVSSSYRSGSVCLHISMRIPASAGHLRWWKSAHSRSGV